MTVAARSHRQRQTLLIDLWPRPNIEVGPQRQVMTANRGTRQVSQQRRAVRPVPKLGGKIIERRQHLGREPRSLYMSGAKVRPPWAIRSSHAPDPPPRIFRNHVGHAAPRQRIVFKLGLRESVTQ